MSRSAGITSNTVPWEILRAAGYSPKLLESEAGPTPHADRYMEDVFDQRIRLIFDRLCGGAWTDLDLVVIPRTSEQEHKLYLYLREVARAGISDTIPRLYLYDLLHTRNSESYSYGLDRTRKMIADLAVTDEALQGAILESNRARSALRQIQLRRDRGVLAGSIAVELIRRFYAGDRAAFADHVTAQLETACTHLATSRPRVLIKGTPIVDSDLHRFVEQAGGYVAAEDDWRGSRAGGETDVSTDSDPGMAIFEKYFYDEVSPRIQGPGERDGWFHRKIETGRIDAVVFYLPVEDDVAGWDYPRQLQWLNQRSVPSLLVQGAEKTASMAAFIGNLLQH